MLYMICQTYVIATLPSMFSHWLTSVINAMLALPTENENFKVKSKIDLWLSSYNVKVPNWATLM